jgi:cytoskeletal protein CcmA (bactofilin family)
MWSTDKNTNTIVEVRMFGKKKQPPIKSLIALGTTITGDIAFVDGLRIDGAVVGNLIAPEGQVSLLVVSETAQISGEVVADHIIINGRVSGPVVARELLELQPKARVEGDVNYKTLEMHQGATITGQLGPLPQTLAVDEKPSLKLAANNG